MNAILHILKSLIKVNLGGEKGNQCEQRNS